MAAPKKTYEIHVDVEAAVEKYAGGDPQSTFAFNLVQNFNVDKSEDLRPNRLTTDGDQAPGKRIMYDWKDVTVAKITHVFDPARNAATQANGDGSATTVLSSAGECDLFFKLEKTDNFDAVSDNSVATVDGEGVHRGDEEHKSLFEVGPPVPIGKSHDGKVAAQSSLWPAAYPTGGGEDSVEVKSADDKWVAVGAADGFGVGRQQLEFESAEVSAWLKKWGTDYSSAFSDTSVQLLRDRVGDKDTAVPLLQFAVADYLSAAARGGWLSVRDLDQGLAATFVSGGVDVDTMDPDGKFAGQLFVKLPADLNQAFTEHCHGTPNRILAKSLRFKTDIPEVKVQVWKGGLGSTPTPFTVAELGPLYSFQRDKDTSVVIDGVRHPTAMLQLISGTHAKLGRRLALSDDTMSTVMQVIDDEDRVAILGTQRGRWSADKKTETVAYSGSTPLLLPPSTGLSPIDHIADLVPCDLTARAIELSADERSLLDTPPPQLAVPMTPTDGGLEALDADKAVMITFGHLAQLSMDGQRAGFKIKRGDRVLRTVTEVLSDRKGNYETTQRLEAFTVRGVHVANDALGRRPDTGRRFLDEATVTLFGPSTQSRLASDSDLKDPTSKQRDRARGEVVYTCACDPKPEVLHRSSIKSIGSPGQYTPGSERLKDYWRADLNRTDNSVMLPADGVQFGSTYRPTDGAWPKSQMTPATIDGNNWTVVSQAALDGMRLSDVDEGRLFSRLGNVDDWYTFKGDKDQRVDYSELSELADGRGGKYARMHVDLSALGCDDMSSTAAYMTWADSPDVTRADKEGVELATGAATNGWEDRVLVQSGKLPDVRRLGVAIMAQPDFVFVGSQDVALDPSTQDERQALLTITNTLGTAVPYGGFYGATDTRWLGKDDPLGSATGLRLTSDYFGSGGRLFASGPKIGQTGQFKMRHAYTANASIYLTNWVPVQSYAARDGYPLYVGRTFERLRAWTFQTPSVISGVFKYNDTYARVTGYDAADVQKAMLVSYEGCRKITRSKVSMPLVVTLQVTEKQSEGQNDEAPEAAYARYRRPEQNRRRPDNVPRSSRLN